MADVDICNLALGYLGDTANITSLAERSVQAQFCSRFYPIARKTLLEMHNWGFATKRVKLAEVTNPTLAIAQGVDPTIDQGTWLYAYALPSDAVNTLAVIPAEAVADYESSFGPVALEFYPPYPQGYVPVPNSPSYVPQEYVTETQPDGTQIVLTNCQDAVLRYTGLVTDTTKFSALFTLALSWLLASMLAGPLIKGDAGAAQSKRCLEMFGSIKGSAAASDANQRKLNIEPSVPWIRGR